MALATSPNDLQLALIENHTAPDETMSTPDSCVRFYEVGRNRCDELTNADGVEVRNLILKWLENHDIVITKLW